MMNNSLTGGNPAAEKIAPYALLGMTVVTGLVDAVSFLSLGRVFTANMTGNIVILAFATAHVSGPSGWFHQFPWIGVLATASAKFGGSPFALSETTPCSRTKLIASMLCEYLRFP